MTSWRRVSDCMCTVFLSLFDIQERPRSRATASEWIRGLRPKGRRRQSMFQAALSRWWLKSSLRDGSRPYRMRAMRRVWPYGGRLAPCGCGTEGEPRQPMEGVSEAQDLPHSLQQEYGHGYRLEIKRPLWVVTRSPLL